MRHCEIQCKLGKEYLTALHGIQITHFILDKILKLLTYITRLSIISRCKVVLSYLKTAVFWPTLYNVVDAAISTRVEILHARS